MRFRLGAAISLAKRDPVSSIFVMGLILDSKSFSHIDYDSAVLFVSNKGSTSLYFSYFFIFVDHHCGDMSLVEVRVFARLLVLATFPIYFNSFALSIFSESVKGSLY